MGVEGLGWFKGRVNRVDRDGIVVEGGVGVGRQWEDGGGWWSGLVLRMG